MAASSSAVFSRRIARAMGAERWSELRSRSEAAGLAASPLPRAAPRHRPAPNQAAAGRRSRRRRTIDLERRCLSCGSRRSGSGRGACSLVERRMLPV